VSAPIQIVRPLVDTLFIVFAIRDGRVCGPSLPCVRIGSTFLNDLNAGDETPGTVKWWTWWSPCDEVINPDSSVALTGATNTQTACLSHSALLIGRAGVVRRCGI
jgi:hypothetical protein